MGKHIKRFLAVLVCAGISFAQALSVGDIVVETALNQPLQATIGMRNIGSNLAEDITVSLARPSDFEIADIEYLGFLNDLWFDVVAVGTSAVKINVTSTKAIREPYVNFLVSIVWPNGHVLKEYTILLDPVFGDTSLSSSHASVAEQVQRAIEPQYTPKPAPKQTPKYAPRLSRSGDDASSVTVLPEDTLWNIAKRAAPAGVSVHQVMHALKAANPDAFIGNNINGLKAGYQLSIPSDSELTHLSTTQAVGASRRDTALWSGGAVATPDRSIAVSNKAAGELQLAAADDNNDAATGEQFDALTSQNDELSSRVGSLEEQVDDLNRLLDLKNKQLALLQRQAGESAGSDGVLGAELAQAEIDVSEAVLETSVDDTAVTQPEVNLDQVDKNLPRMLAANQPLKGGMPQNFEPTLALWQQAPVQLGGLGGACLLLLGVLWLRRSTPEEAFVVEDGDVVLGTSDEGEDDDYIPLPDSDSVDDSDTFDELESLSEEFKVDGYDVAIANLEAKVDAQAHRADLRLLLLQKSSEAGDKDRFIENYRFLEAIARPEDLQTAERILAASQGSTVWLDADAGDDDDFFKEIVHEAELTDEIEALLLASEGEASLDDQQDVEDFDFESLDGQLSLDETPLDTFDGIEDDEDDTNGLDVSLDIEDDVSLDLNDGQPEDDDAGLDFEQTLIISPEDDSGAAVLFEEDDLDFDFDISTDDSDVSEQELVTGQDDALDFESTVAVSSTDIDVSSKSDEELAAVDEIDLDGFDDFSFDDDALSLDELSEQDSIESSGDELDDELLAFDDDELAGFDLGEDLNELGDAEALTDELVGDRDEDDEIFAVSQDEVDVDFDDELDVFDGSDETDDFDDFTGFLDGADEASIADEDEVATKIELGEAFIEMGDISGAKEILAEVLDEGDVVQQAAARELLDNLGS